MASWISDILLQNSYSVALCMSQKDFDLHLSMCGLRKQGKYLLPGAHATGHQFDDTDIGPVFIVAVSSHIPKTPIDAACELVHEAVHIWQAHCSYIGETDPGYEIEAYSIQCLSKHLMEAYTSKLTYKRRK